MKALGKASSLVFNRLIEGMVIDGEIKIQHRKWKSESENYMPIVVEVVNKVKLGHIFSVAHIYIQNGDVMCDPEITFLVTMFGCIYPLSFKQDSVNMDNTYVHFDEEGNIKHFYLKEQKDVVTFCNMWMKNIKNQGFVTVE